MSTRAVRELDPEHGRSRLERLIPAWSRLRSYRPSAAGRDLVAGLVVDRLIDGVEALQARCAAHDEGDFNV